MRFKIAYIVFFVSILFYSSFRVVGPVTPRHIMTIVMFVMCINEDKKVYQDKYFRWYLLFIFCFGFSSLWTYYLDKFLTFLLAYFFVAYVAYWATMILIKKHNGTSVLVNTIVVLGILNALTTIGQFYEIGIFNRIPEIMRINVSEDFLDLAEERDEFEGISLPGLLSGAVSNGYFAMTATLLSLWYQRNRFSFIRLIPWGIGMIGLYVTQQRAPFFITTALSLYIMFKVMGKNTGGLTLIIRLAFIVVAVFGVLYFLAYTSSSEMRYVKGFEDKSRVGLIQKTMEYLSQHILLGGRFHSQSMGVRPPHNLFLNAWLYGGILGLFVIFGITIKQVVLVAKQTIGKQFLMDYSKTIFGLVFLAYTVNSMVHNQSIVTGDAVIWILWGAFQEEFVDDDEDEEDEDEEDEDEEDEEDPQPGQIIIV